MPETVARPTGHPGYTETLPRTALSAGAARRLVRTALTAWGVEHLADTAALVVSELITNAIEHTDCRSVRVAVTRPTAGLVRVEVVDGVPRFPVRRAITEQDEHGRGLAIVEAVCWRWGTDRLPWGKRVWGELRCQRAERLPDPALPPDRSERP